VDYTKRLLAQIGLEPDRLEMINVSSAMASQFAEAARKMTEQIVALGPSPLRPQGQTSPAPGALQRQIISQDGQA